MSITRAVNSAKSLEIIQIDIPLYKSYQNHKGGESTGEVFKNKSFKSLKGKMYEKKTPLPSYSQHNGKISRTGTAYHNTI
ncbi:hypothetical protein GCM10023261_09560 [Bartonella jaculi]|uniref:Uncharacterized protein n=1 Tax=Bartonella jaculi TaxID=686226 RepID=A0ABP9N4Q4_9HYPH